MHTLQKLYILLFFNPFYIQLLASPCKLETRLVRTKFWFSYSSLFLHCPSAQFCEGAACQHFVWQTKQSQYESWSCILLFPFFSLFGVFFLFSSFLFFSSSFSFDVWVAWWPGCVLSRENWSFPPYSPPTHTNKKYKQWFPQWKLEGVK